MSSDVSGGTPGSIEIDVDLVTELLRSQAPDLAGMRIRPFAEGWDNVSFRLGEDWLVRLPKHAISAGLLRQEQRFLSEMASRLPLQVPAPRHLGEPGAGYPWSWAVCSHIPGVTADRSPPDEPGAAADRLGRFLRATHRPDQRGEAPRNPFRGVPLLTRDQTTRERLGGLRNREEIDAGALVECWEAALEVADYDETPLWIHGDMHPHNLLVDGGRLVGVVDFGDITSGDPATDLSVAWMLLPLETHPRFRESYGQHDESLWARARGWALSLGVAFLTPTHGSTSMEATGLQTLERVLADHP